MDDIKEEHTHKQNDGIRGMKQRKKTHRQTEMQKERTNKLKKTRQKKEIQKGRHTERKTQ